jgi:hypothetical protein
MESHYLDLLRGVSHTRQNISNPRAHGTDILQCVRSWIHIHIEETTLCTRM